MVASLEIEILKEFLKKSRKAAKFTQKELADKLNMSRTYYADIEHGRCKPNLIQFSKIAAILDIDMNILKPNYKNE